MMVNSVLVLFALDVGSTLTEVGLMRSIGGAMGIILNVPFGILSDKYGRKSMLLLAQTMMALGDAIRCVAITPLHVILASTVGGIAGGGYFPILLSAIGDSTTIEESIEERNDAISTLYFFSSMGLLAGPTLASVLLLFLEIRTLFYIAIVSRIGLLIFIFLTIKSVRGETRRLSLKGNTIGLVKQKNMVVSMMTSTPFYFTNSIFQTYMPIFARQELFLSDSLVASLDTFRSLLILMVRFFMQQILSKIKHKRLLVLMLITAFIAGLLIPYATGYYSLIPIAMTFGMCFGVISVICALIISSVSTPTNRGLANSLHSLTTSTGMFAPLAMTPIAEIWGLNSVFTTSAFLPLIAIPPILFLMQPLTNNA
jgi:MFS family permease